ncbi:MAG: hypothetical protein IJW83_02060 [Clostridia bacterium]|nr:hypothetical protein [Clostridia bacterium]
MKYSFEQIKSYLQELLETYCEPELSLWIKDREYMIILYDDYCSFQTCDGTMKVLNFASLDELYTAEVYDGIVLKNDWDRISKIECIDFDYLHLPTEILPCTDSMHELNIIYEKLKNTYNLTRTNTFSLNDGYTIDVPVIRGTAADRRFDLYKEEDMFVFSVEFFDKAGDGKYSHTHPYDVEDAIHCIEAFMSGKSMFD